MLLHWSEIEKASELLYIYIVIYSDTKIIENIIYRGLVYYTYQFNDLCTHLFHS